MIFIIAKIQLILMVRFVQLLKAIFAKSALFKETVLELFIFLEEIFRM